VVYFLIPESTANVKIEEKRVKVEDGFEYAKSSEKQIDIYPFMLQKRFLGVPSETGVNASLYYITKKDFERAKNEYEKSGGCWATTFSKYKKELMIVGNSKKITNLVKAEGPPPVYGEPTFVTITGNNLSLIEKDQDSEIANHIASARNGNFFLVNSVWNIVE
jgi:hypothetical protein